MVFGRRADKFVDPQAKKKCRGGDPGAWSRYRVPWEMVSTGVHAIHQRSGSTVLSTFHPDTAAIAGLDLELPSGTFSQHYRTPTGVLRTLQKLVEEVIIQFLPWLTFQAHIPSTREAEFYYLLRLSW